MLLMLVDPSAFLRHGERTRVREVQERKDQKSKKESNNIDS
jgi:hypothetical protein